MFWKIEITQNTRKRTPMPSKNSETPDSPQNPSAALREPKQLTDGDAIFLSMETPAAGGHVGALMLLEPPGDEPIDFEHVRKHVISRVALVPRFSWKLQSVPLGADRPYWVEAPEFDPRDHIIRTAIPTPGTMQQLTSLVGRLHAQPMDRTRPLWEVWCIEGLEGGRVAIYQKTHHCLVDGSGGTGLAEIMADLSPDATSPPIVPDGFNEAPPAPPSAIELAKRALSNAVSRPSRLANHLARGVRQWVGSLGEEDDEGVERLSFNRNISRKRSIATASIKLERVLDLKKHFDVKVNDVVLEIVGSATNRWLRDEGRKSDRPIFAMCPISTRGDENGLGNQITNMTVSLATNLADPAARLAKIHENSTAAKLGVEKGSFDWMAIMGESLAPGAAEWMMKAADLAGDLGPLPGNFVVSNVRATPVPLYMAGARIVSIMPLSMLTVGQGLNFTVVSYCDHIDVGILVDPELVPDPWALADYLPTALEELEAAAEGVIHQAR
jgi:diacylglycerol O-acyltransferase